MQPEAHFNEMKKNNTQSQIGPLYDGTGILAKADTKDLRDKRDAVTRWRVIFSLIIFCK